MMRSPLRGISIIAILSAASLRAGPRFLTVDYPGSGSTSLFDINAAGQIVGLEGPSLSAQPFFTDTNRNIGSAFGYQGGSFTVPWGIDNAGDVIGFSTTGYFFRSPTGILTA